MPTLADIRTQYPQYSDMPDADLANALHKQFYSDMPQADFFKAIGLDADPLKITKPPADTNETINALSGGFVRGIPLIGPAIDSGSQKVAARIRSMLTGGKYEDELKAIEDYAKGIKERNPGKELAGNLVGGVAALGPIGMTGAGASAMGITGANFLSRAAKGAATFGALGAGDAAVRGEDPGTGAIIGAGAGAAAPAIGSAVTRLVSPTQARATLQPFINTLDREGVQMTAGERAGSKPLRWFESSMGDMPGAAEAMTTFKDAQGRQYTQAALRRMGEMGNELATPDVMQRAATRIGQQFEDLSTRNTLRYDRQLMADLGNAIRDYQGAVMPSQQRAPVADYVTDIVTRMLQNNGRLDGQLYQNTRSQLTRQADALRTNDPTLARALNGIRDALDDAMGRSITQADSAAWQTARREWAAMKTIEKAVSGAGSRTAEGFVSPSQLRTAVKTLNATGYVRGHGDLAELARAGEAVLKELPNSGTAPRSMMMRGALSTLGTGLAGQAIMSPAVQWYLANRALGPATQQALTRAAQPPLFELGERR